MTGTSAFLLQICFLSACSNALSVNINKAVVGANKRPTPFSRHRYHHNNNRNRRRRTAASLVYCPAFLQKTSRSFALAAKPPPCPRRRKDNKQMVDIHNSLEEAMLAPPRMGQCGRRGAGQSSSTTDPSQPRIAEQMRPPPQPSSTNDDTFSETRSRRSESSASRNSNRLSLTLPIPIALPSAHPSRPTPTSATMTSYPPTPLDTPSSLTSPVDQGDWITAIAAQERRVLELREELARADSELSRLKKHWANHEAHKKRAEIRNAEPMRPVGPHADTPEDPLARRSVELDRRKALLLGQQSQQGTPTQKRGRVFHGGHTRTLSLLSPTKPTGGDGFAVHEDRPGREGGVIGSPTAAGEDDSPYVSHYAPILPSKPSKRASWAPRSVHQQTSGVKQIAEDLKTGLWTFMEDLRQATVGDEPITGNGSYLRGIDGNMRSTHGREGDEGQDTIRASGAPARPRAVSVFDHDGTPTPASRFAHVEAAEKEEKENGEGITPARHDSTGSKAGRTGTAKGSKHFSWTPLTMDAYDDSDWSSWDSPTVKTSSPRWSGSTVGGDIVTGSADENGNGMRRPSPKKTHSTGRLRNHSPSPLSSTPSTSSTTNKLEELLPPVLNRLTPSNLKKTASDFMKEWERSLSPPAAAEDNKARLD